MEYTSIMQNFNVILEKYGLGSLCNEPKKMGGASGNINFALETPQGRYFCRMHRGFSQQYALLHRILTHLTDKRFSTASLLRTTYGETYVKYNNQFYELFEFIQGEEFEKVNQIQFASMGGLLAKFHECMQDFECSFPFEYFVGNSTWNNYPHLQRQAQFIQYSSKDMVNKNGPIELREEIIKALTQTRQKMEQVTTNWEHIESVLSHTFIYGDYHPNNVLFKGNKAAYICDFDFVMPAERIFDITTAFVCYKWMYEYDDYPKDEEESEPDMFFFKPYIDFLSNYNEQTTQRFTLEELKALVPDMQRLLLLYGSKAAMHGDDLEGMLRWLTARLKRVEWLEHYQVEFERAFLSI